MKNARAKSKHARHPGRALITGAARTGGRRIADAVFIGWQRTAEGKSFALYNIIDVNHPAYGSTVTEETLGKMNLRIPRHPLSHHTAPTFIHGKTA